MKNYVTTLALLGLAVAFGIENPAQARTRNIDGARMDRLVVKQDRNRAARSDKEAFRPDKMTCLDKCTCCEIGLGLVRSERPERQELADRREAAGMDVSREIHALRSGLVKHDWDIRERQDAVRYLEKSET